MSRALFAGEQVTAISHEIKGFDSFEVSANREDAQDHSHPVLAGVPSEWPFFLGYNKVVPKDAGDRSSHEPKWPGASAAMKPYGRLEQEVCSWCESCWCA